MKHEGPPLQKLTHRLSECPAEFLLPPRVRWSGDIYVDALVFDTLREIGEPYAAPKRDDVLIFDHNATEDQNWLQAVVIACWLLGDDYFQNKNKFAMALREWLRGGLQEVTKVVESPQFVHDPDRREEFCRLCLQAIQRRPQGESEAAATDRLTTLSSIERHRVLLATREAQKRAEEIREAMRQKAAEEAAAKYTRE